MAFIAPFRGLRYNEAKDGIDFRFEDVITPPYDVISPEEREQFRLRSPYNFVHVDLPKAEESCKDSLEPYRKSSELLKQWITSKILIKDREPSFYYYEIDYKLPSKLGLHTRKGFFALLRLEEFHSGCVYPHEKTFAKVKEDRLMLSLCCEAHLSPIFMLYRDKEKLIEILKDKAYENSTIVNYKDSQNISHRMWKISDEKTCKLLQEAFLEKEIYIADGHHRYETALAYRDRKRKEKGFREDAPYEFTLVYLSPMEDEGLVILPTHRVFPDIPLESSLKFLEKASEFFEVESFSTTEEGIHGFLQVQEENAKEGRNFIGFTYHGSNNLYLLKPKLEKLYTFFKSINLEEVFWDIDVVILDKLIFNHLMSIDHRLLEDEKKICFSHDTVKAIKEVLEGKYKTGFLINPTRIDQVVKVASRCLVMPHKSTYFYPKVVSGLVIYPMMENNAF